MSSSFLCPVFPFSRFLPQNPFILSKVQNHLETLSYLEHEITNIEQFLADSAQRKAQMDYFIGMLIGVGIWSTILVGFGFLLRIPKLLIDQTMIAFFTENQQLLSASLVAGEIGAVISVLSRMTSGSLHLNYEAGPKTIRCLGAIRPIIGSVFGLVIHGLVESRFIPFDVPQDLKGKLYFYSIIGFIAGFSERWAQDMLGTAQTTVTANSGKRQPGAGRKAQLKTDADRFLFILFYCKFVLVKKVLR